MVQQPLDTPSTPSVVATSASASVLLPTVVVRTRPAVEKLWIGPLMVLGEMLTGGHYLEVLRLGKQMTVGHEAGPSYRNLHQTYLQQAQGSLFTAFYRGFVPWGLVQCAKGVPVLFVQHESLYHLQATFGWTNQRQAELMSGVLGGAAQALFVCPLQTMKVHVVATPELHGANPWTATRHVVQTRGITALFDGLFPMMIRRSLDWGLRFAVSNEARNRIIAYKVDQGHASQQLQVHEWIACGLVGGAASASTHPIDNVITNSQKPLQDPHASRSVGAVVQRMWRESGTRAFTRGWGIKIVDNAYHMAWMYGIGTVLYDVVAQALRPTTPGGA